MEKTAPPPNVEALLAKAKQPSADAMRLHPYYRGKVEIALKCRVRDFNDFAIWYTPGVAAPCRAIAENPDAAPIPTIKQRLVRLARSTKMPAKRKIKLIRRYLRLSQSEFAEAYGIPVRTLQNWEAGRREPEEGILSYLSVIADMPDQVRRSLRKSA